jgi:O-antigen ligase
LAYGAFFTALYLRIRGKTGAALFAAYSLILAVWATAVPHSGSIPAKDVVALIQALKSNLPP